MSAEVSTSQVSGSHVAVEQVRQAHAVELEEIANWQWS